MSQANGGGPWRSPPSLDSEEGIGNFYAATGLASSRHARPPSSSVKPHLAHRKKASQSQENHKENPPSQKIAVSAWEPVESKKVSNSKWGAARFGPRHVIRPVEGIDGVVNVSRETAEYGGTSKEANLEAKSSPNQPVVRTGEGIRRDVSEEPTDKNNADLDPAKERLMRRLQDSDHGGDTDEDVNISRKGKEHALTDLREEEPPELEEFNELRSRIRPNGQELTPEEHRSDHWKTSLSSTFVPASTSSDTPEKPIKQFKDITPAPSSSALRSAPVQHSASLHVGPITPSSGKISPHIQAYSALLESTRPVERSPLRFELDHVPATDDYEPDLTAHGAPRPDHNFSESSPSMPSEVSSFIISDTGVENIGFSDVRNTIAPEHLFQPSGDKKLTKNIWADEWERNSILQSEGYLSAFIKAWVAGVPYNTKATFLEESVPMHWYCDVDTDTAELIEPVKCPEAYLNHQSVDPKLAWKQSNWTSELLIRRRAATAAKKANRNGAYGPPRPPPGWMSSFEVKRKFEDPNQTTAVVTKAEPTPVIEPEPEVEILHPDAPKIACYMRPAGKDDMQGVSDIYAWEVNHGSQALDSVPLSAEEFEGILNKTQSLRMPFVVMVASSTNPLALDSSLNSQYPQHKKDLEEGPRSEKIVGFGYLSVWQSGLSGHCDGTSRLSARVNVFVHPEYRKKKIGFSLLDKLMSVASDNFSSGDGYDFLNYDQDPAYDSFRPHRKVKPFFKLYVQYFVRSKPEKKANATWSPKAEGYDADLKWMETFLAHPFRFEKPNNRMACSHRTKRDERNQEFFMDLVIFEHTGNSRNEYPELQE